MFTLPKERTRCLLSLLRPCRSLFSSSEAADAHPVFVHVRRPPPRQIRGSTVQTQQRSSCAADFRHASSLRLPPPAVSPRCRVEHPRLREQQLGKVALAAHNSSTRSAKQITSVPVGIVVTEAAIEEGERGRYRTTRNALLTVSPPPHTTSQQWYQRLR